MAAIASLVSSFSLIFGGCCANVRGLKHSVIRETNLSIGLLLGSNCQVRMSNRCVS
jgi:hypothetical protein